MDDRDWQAAAPCTDLETTGARDLSSHVAMWEVSARGAVSSKARLICDECPVWRECLTEGWRDGYMLRGRTTPDQRIRFRRQGLTAADVVANPHLVTATDEEREMTPALTAV